MKLNITVTLVISVLAFFASSITTAWYESFIFTFEPLFRFIPLLLVVSWLPKLLVYGVAGFVMGRWAKPTHPYRWAALVGGLALVPDLITFPLNETGYASSTELIYLTVLFFVPLFGVLAGAKLYLKRAQPIKPLK